MGLPTNNPKDNDPQGCVYTAKVLLSIAFIIMLCLTTIVGYIWLRQQGFFAKTQPAIQPFSTVPPTQIILITTPTVESTPTILTTTMEERWIINMVWDNYTIYNGIPSDVVELIPEGATIGPTQPIKRYGICITPQADNPQIGEVYIFDPHTNHFEPEDQTGQTFLLVTITEEK